MPSAEEQYSSFQAQQQQAYMAALNRNLQAARELAAQDSGYQTNSLGQQVVTPTMRQTLQDIRSGQATAEQIHSYLVSRGGPYVDPQAEANKIQYTGQPMVSRPNATVEQVQAAEAKEHVQGVPGGMFLAPGATYFSHASGRVYSGSPQGVVEQSARAQPSQTTAASSAARSAPAVELARPSPLEFVVSQGYGASGKGVVGSTGWQKPSLSASAFVPSSSGAPSSMRNTTPLLTQSSTESSVRDYIEIKTGAKFGNPGAVQQIQYANTPGGALQEFTAKQEAALPNAGADRAVGELGIAALTFGGAAIGTAESIFFHPVESVKATVKQAKDVVSNPIGAAQGAYSFAMARPGAALGETAFLVASSEVGGRLVSKVLPGVSKTIYETQELQGISFKGTTTFQEGVPKTIFEPYGLKFESRVFETAPDVKVAEQLGGYVERRVTGVTPEGFGSSTKEVFYGKLAPEFSTAKAAEGTAFKGFTPEYAEARAGFTHGGLQGESLVYSRVKPTAEAFVQEIRPATELTPGGLKSIEFQLHERLSPAAQVTINPEPGTPAGYLISKEITLAKQTISFTEKSPSGVQAVSERVRIELQPEVKTSFTKLAEPSAPIEFEKIKALSTPQKLEVKPLEQIKAAEFGGEVKSTAGRQVQKQVSITQPGQQAVSSKIVVRYPQAEKMFGYETIQEKTIVMPREFQRFLPAPLMQPTAEFAGMTSLQSIRQVKTADVIQTRQALGYDVSLKSGAKDFLGVGQPQPQALRTPQVQRMFFEQPFKEIVGVKELQLQGTRQMPVEVVVPKTIQEPQMFRLPPGGGLGWPYIPPSGSGGGGGSSGSAGFDFLGGHRRGRRSGIMPTPWAGPFSKGAAEAKTGLPALHPALSKKLFKEYYAKVLPSGGNREIQAIPQGLKKMVKFISGKRKRKGEY